MRTSRLSLAGAVILTLLAGMGGASLAQDEAARNSGFTMKVVDYSEDWTVQQVEASDPRLTGTWTIVENCEDEGPRLGVCVGSVRVENEGGTWRGQSHSAWAATPGFLSSWTVLEGDGGYAGLTATMYNDEEKMGNDPDLDGEGVIFDFAMPPMPELPAE
jgi:hypothetical protein